MVLKHQSVLLAYRLSRYGINAVKSVHRRWFSLPRKEGWQSAIGLEIHAQIDTQSKLFSSGKTVFGAPANTQVSHFDAAIPGTLPVLNRKCVKAAVLTALSLDCDINQASNFDRKHYFYADLPAGYQITQQRNPIAKNGHLNFIIYSPILHKRPYYKKCRIIQLQLEQDSGKSLHDTQEQKSLIDLNRAGVPLMEIVFHPDLRNGEEAGALVKELMTILLNLKTCNCRMEEGSLRVDANVSVNRKGEPMGTRTEVKNISSVRSLVNAIEFEVDRQIEILEGGGTIINETRSYDAVKKETIAMRDKEVLQDYRFMPEPNIPILKLKNDPSFATEDSDVEELDDFINIACLRQMVKPHPDVLRLLLVRTYSVRLEEAIVMVNTPGLWPYFYEVMQDAKLEKGALIASIFINELMEKLNERNMNYHNCPIRPAPIIELADLLESGKINRTILSDVLELLFEGNTKTPGQIIEEKDWIQVIDVSEITSVCYQVMELNKNVVDKYVMTKKAKHFNKLMGEIKKFSQVKYDMKKASEILQHLLSRIKK